MCVRLPHQKEVAEIVVFTPQVADYNARRDPCQSHQSSETRGIVFAESHAASKKKFFQVIVFAWSQRIAKPLRPEELKRAAYYAARVTILCRPGLRQVPDLWTDRRRYLERFPSFPRSDFVAAEV